MPVLMTNTPSLEERMQELQRKLSKKESEIANLAACLENREREKPNEAGNSDTIITQQDIKKLIVPWIKEH